MMREYPKYRVRTTEGDPVSLIGFDDLGMALHVYRAWVDEMSAPGDLVALDRFGEDGFYHVVEEARFE